VAVDDGSELWLGVVRQEVRVVPEDSCIGCVSDVVEAIGEDVELSGIAGEKVVFADWDGECEGGEEYCCSNGAREKWELHADVMKQSKVKSGEW